MRLPGARLRRPGGLRLGRTCFLLVVCVLLTTFADFAWWIVVVVVADSLSPLTTRQIKIPDISVTSFDIWSP